MLVELNTFMAFDSDAVLVTLNYAGGSITLPIGNAKDLFGDDGYEILRPSPVDVTISKKAHTRTRVIGGPTTNVEATTYTYKQWPRTRRSNAAGGQKIMMRWEGSQGSWTARMTGSASDLGTYLNATAPKPVTFATAGSNYGPFVKEATP